MTNNQCPLGEHCNQTIEALAWAEAILKGQDLIKSQAAEIERLRGAMAKLIGGSETVLEAWDHHMRDVVVSASLNDAIEELRADVVEALTVSTTVKDSLTTEDEKQSHEWKCPIDYPGCRKYCGSPYGCKT